MNLEDLIYFIIYLYLIGLKLIILLPAYSSSEGLPIIPSFSIYSFSNLSISFLISALLSWSNCSEVNYLALDIYMVIIGYWGY